MPKDESWPAYLSSCLRDGVWGSTVGSLCSQRIQVTPKLVALLGLILRCHQFSPVCFCVWDQGEFPLCDSGHLGRTQEIFAIDNVNEAD